MKLPRTVAANAKTHTRPRGTRPSQLKEEVEKGYQKANASVF